MDIKILGEGQLPDTLGDLYTAPAGKSAIIKSIIIVNNNTTTETLNIYILKSGSTARKIIPKDLQLDAGYSCVIDDGITLGDGDKIQGVTTTASEVDYTINGVEK